MRSDVTSPRIAATTVVSDCQKFGADLSEAADGGEWRNSLAAGHVGTCLRCQAELAQYKKLRRALSNLRGQLLRPDDFLLNDILTALAEVGSRQRRLPSLDGRRISTVAATAGAAACTAGAIVLANRLNARHRLAG